MIVDASPKGKMDATCPDGLIHAFCPMILVAAVLRFGLL